MSDTTTLAPGRDDTGGSDELEAETDLVLAEQAAAERARARVVAGARLKARRRMEAERAAARAAAEEAAAARQERLAAGQVAADGTGDQAEEPPAEDTPDGGPGLDVDHPASSTVDAPQPGEQDAAEGPQGSEG